MKFVCYDLMAVVTQRLKEDAPSSPTRVALMGSVVPDEFMSHIAFDAFNDLLDCKKLKEGLGAIIDRGSTKDGEDEFKIVSFLVDPDIVKEGKVLPSSINLIEPKLLLIKVGSIKPFEMDTGNIQSNLLDLMELASTTVNEWKDDKKNKPTYQFLIEEALKGFLQKANMISEDNTIVNQHGDKIMSPTSDHSKYN